MKYKLICMDIDGTLLNDDKSIPSRVNESLQRAYKQGVHIALVTARMPEGTRKIEEQLGIPCIKSCNAGAYILMKEQCIFNKMMRPEILELLEEKVSGKEHIPFWIFQGEDWYVTGMNSFVEREMEVIGYCPEIAAAGQLAAKWKLKGMGPNKLLIAAEPELLQKIREDIEEIKFSEISIARSSDVFLEISPENVTKGTALSVICRELGIDVKESIAFGDQEMDIPLIETAGVGVAMGNAIDELKRAADYVTKSNNEGGIADALEYFL